MLLCGVSSYPSIEHTCFSGLMTWRKALALCFIVNLATWYGLFLVYCLGHSIWTNLFGKYATMLLLIAQIYLFCGNTGRDVLSLFSTRLNEVHSRKWLIFGIPIGLGAIVANLFFAFGHSMLSSNGGTLDHLTWFELG